MQVSVETVSTLGRRLTVAVPADRIEQVFTDRLKSFAKKVRLPGFRPGKVPLKMVEARYGGSLMEEVAGELIQSTLREAMGQEGLKPVGGTKIERRPLERGKELQYTAEFEVYPEIKRIDLSGVHIERPVTQVTDEDIDRTLQSIRKQRTRWNPVDREAREGDRLTVDFVGRIDGEEIQGTKAENVPVVLGAGTLVDGLEEGLVGVKAGETRHVTVKFPGDYGHEPLRGKEMDFEVKTNRVAEGVVPELDEEFAKQLGIADGKIENLRAEVRGTLEREAENRSRALVRGRVLEVLLELNKFEVPANLINAEMARMRYQAQQAGLAGARQESQAADFEERARRRVALALILAEIIQKRSIRPDTVKVRARVEQLAAQYEAPQEVIQWYYSEPERLGEIESLVMEEQVVDELLKTAEVADVSVRFQDLLKSGTPA